MANKSDQLFEMAAGWAWLGPNHHRILMLYCMCPELSLYNTSSDFKMEF